MNAAPPAAAGDESSPLLLSEEHKNNGESRTTKYMYGLDDDGGGRQKTQQKEEEETGDDEDSTSIVFWDGAPGHGITTGFPAYLIDSINRISTRVWQHVGHIGVLGSISIATNFLTGPAMLEIPAVFQRSGIIPTTCTIVLVGVLASLGSLHMARAISQVPGNTNFEREVEYSEAFRQLFATSDRRKDNDAGLAKSPSLSSSSSSTKSVSSTQAATNSSRSHRWFIGTQLVFFACITCLNISSLVDSAQVFDTILANIMGGTHALQITWANTTTSAAATGAAAESSTSTLLEFHWIEWTYASCSQEVLLEGRCIPFDETGDGDDDGVLLTVGYLFNILCFLPLSLMNLQENAAWQVVEFLVLIVTSIIFSVLFWQNGLVWDDDRISWWGDSWDGLMGVILFNFALVISVSSWLYEKESNVDAKSVIVGSTVLAALLYMLVGILGAMSMPHVSENMLETFMSGVLGTSMQWTASIFALFIVGLGIPLLCVLCRLNLTGSGMKHSTANWWAVYLPFGLSWLMYRGDLVTQLLSWGGVIFTSLIAFIFPLLLALQALRIHRDDPGTIVVYGRRWADASTEALERRALYVLLGISILAIVAAIVGNILGGGEASSHGSFAHEISRLTEMTLVV